MKYENKMAILAIVMGASMIIGIVSFFIVLTEYNNDRGTHYVTVLQPPKHVYMIQNYSDAMDLNLSINGTIVCVHEEITCKSFVLVADPLLNGNYSLYVCIEGLYINASVEMDGIVGGGTVTLDYFEMHSEIEEFDLEDVQEQLLKDITVIKWTMEA